MSRSRPAYKALTSDSWHAHSHPAGWARSSLESRAKPQPGPRMPRTLKPLILVAAILAIGAALGTTAQPAQARSLSVCSKALVHDWLVDGRVDKTYPVHCYREALRTIPEDQLVYGTLRDDLNRALQNTIRKHNGHVDNDTPVPGAGGRRRRWRRWRWRLGRNGRQRRRVPLGRPHARTEHRRLGPGAAARPRRARTCVDGGRRNQLFRSPDAGPAGGGRSATRRTLLLDAAEARACAGRETRRQHYEPEKRDEQQAEPRERELGERPRLTGRRLGGAERVASPVRCALGGAATRLRQPTAVEDGESAAVPEAESDSSAAESTERNVANGPDCAVPVEPAASFHHQAAPHRSSRSRCSFHRRRASPAPMWSCRPLRRQVLPSLHPTGTHRSSRRKSCLRRSERHRSSPKRYCCRYRRQLAERLRSRCCPRPLQTPTVRRARSSPERCRWSCSRCSRHRPGRRRSSSWRCCYPNHRCEPARTRRQSRLTDSHRPWV